MSSDAGPTRTRPALPAELAAGLAVFGYYLLVDFLGGPGRRATADRNAEHVMALERWLHIDAVQALNDWLHPHAVLTTLANYEYATTYVISAFALLAWLYVRAPDDYRRARSSFIVLNLAAITCFWLYPVTPPRLLPDLGLVDTVATGGTVGSWGSPLVAEANQLAAMPSLHVAWALWVSIVLAWLAQGYLVQAASAVHVALTVFVIVATANHYLVDAVAAVPFVWASVAVVQWHRNRRHNRDRAAVPSADAFFLSVETDAAPQHVGGMVVLAPSPTGTPTVEDVRELIRSELGALPRFRQRLAPQTRWRRPRWTDADEIDWEWHVCERTASTPVRTGESEETELENAAAALSRAVADLAAERLPRDRPLWRMVLVREISPGRTGLVFLVHHCVADGIGTVVQAMRLLRPHIALPSGQSAPGTLRIAGATALGLAQLATDGRPAARLRRASDRRRFATVALDLTTVRAVARARGTRVTDLLLCLIATAIARTHPAFVAEVRGRMRTSVPLMLRAPGSAAEGNVTAAVMLDVPVRADLGIAERLAEIGARTARLRTPTRAVASRFVMATVLGALPMPAQRAFARAVYGPAFFQAIVSNMPGPDVALTFEDVPLEFVVPILPLAPGVPLALGALSWHGTLGVGLATDPELLDADLLTGEMAAVLDEFATGAVQSGAGPHSSASNMRARARGESSSVPKSLRSWAKR